MAISPSIARARKNRRKPREFAADAGRVRSGSPIRQAASAGIRLREPVASKVHALSAPARRFHRIGMGPDAAKAPACSAASRLDRLASSRSPIREEPKARKPETPAHRMASTVHGMASKCREAICPAHADRAPFGPSLLDRSLGETRPDGAARERHAPIRAEACPA